MFGITGAMVANWGYMISLAAPATILVGIVWFRTGMVDYKLPLLLVSLSFPAAILSLVLTVPAVIFGQSEQMNLTHAAMAVGISLVVIVSLVMAGRTLEKLPRVNDVMTNFDNPPQFDIVPTQRKTFDNSVELKPKRLEALQKAYPDIKPGRLAGSPDANFDKALAQVRQEGWKVVAANKEAGVIEATDASLVFGFKDDIVIRLTAEDGGTRVDVRSASRQGQSDFRANANRIEKYIDALAD